MTPLLDWASSDILSSVKQAGFVAEQVSLLVSLWAENTSGKRNIAPVNSIFIAIIIVELEIFICYF